MGSRDPGWLKPERAGLAGSRVEVEPAHRPSIWPGKTPTSIRGRFAPGERAFRFSTARFKVFEGRASRFSKGALSGFRGGALQRFREVRWSLGAWATEALGF
jgi:hypothetical protein